MSSVVEPFEISDLDINEPEATDGSAIVELVQPQDETVATLQGSSIALVPPEAEMKALVQLAVTLSAANLVPRALRDKPNDVLLVLLTARDLGIKITTALRLCHPIDGQVTIAPKLKLAIIRERGLGRVWPDPANDHLVATWHATRSDDLDTTFSSTFTMDQAVAAGLAKKDNWRTYPARMLSWRSIGYLMDDAFGEVGVGLYSPDELGAITDDEGHPILDVTEVGPLAGTSEPKSMTQARRRRVAAPNPGDELATPEERDRFDGMLRALPVEGLAVAKPLWAQAVGCKIAELPLKRVPTAEALCESLWKRAEGGEWGEWTRPTSDRPQEPEKVIGHNPASETLETLSGASRGLYGEPWNLPDLADVDAVIVWAEHLLDDEVSQWLYGIGEDCESTNANDRRRALALRVAADLGLMS